MSEFHWHDDTYDDHDHDPLEEPSTTYNGRGHYHDTELDPSTPDDRP